MKIIVLAGGLSPERDVSLSSGALISNALIEKGHDVMLLDLYLGINNKHIEPAYINLKSNKTFSYLVPPEEPDLDAIKASVNNRGSLIGDGIIDLCKEADVVFLALHGSIGENGKLQAVLDINGIKYTGTGYVGSLLAMDKDLSKKLILSNNILTPHWKYVDLQTDTDFDDINYPCVVKPCSCGSSVGVTMVETPSELNSAIEFAKKYENSVIIEEKIVGREFSVGILNGEALPVIEIKPLIGFYDYKNKYQKGLTGEICPANISNEIRYLLQNSAVKVHNLLRLGFYSRIDFILDQSNNAYCLEANTLPGMTPTSLLPQEALANDITYSDLCEKIAFAI
ncbi:D-alanine--D-alanine ligase [Syntrophobotulus glycolicus DSM 8271]|uniref:D-alanine--D-alanine ligase n=1 Tax=Syntrophobotulus glycolicus (strain DSM 8271 / FlGlyR) TaxID=645991 RepID=F0T1Z6_SYNGF|nr:D-alanine--D-alanine ligase [Syntrophobotulus glycolicus]ADY55260.1 D-alanine--D-alanine ligase [Syntrophobotulus glycolicus DSM 8271]